MHIPFSFDDNPNNDHQEQPDQLELCLTNALPIFNDDRDALAQKLHLTLYNLPIGCIVHDYDFKITYWNPAAETIFGYSIDEAIGKLPEDLIVPDRSKSVLSEIFCQMVDNDKKVNTTGENITKDKRTIICSWINIPLHKADGTFAGLIALCQDITERIRVEEALHLSEENYKQIVDTALEGIWLIDAEGRTTLVNQRMSDLLGYPAVDLIGCTFFDYVDPDQQADARRKIRQSQRGRNEKFELRLQRKDNSYVWVLVSSCPFNDKNGKYAGALSMITDITDRKRNEQMIWWQAYHDSLTGLPNRALFEDRLGQLLVMAKRQITHVAVMFLDIDRFKHINDTLSHAVGDKLLKVVSERLLNCLRSEDTIARLGGDEFTILLPGISSPEDAARVARKMLEVLTHGITIGSHELYITASIGISLFPIDGQDTQALLKNADTAMYRSKEQGGNSYHLYTQSMNASALEHLMMENSLRKAIERNELYLVYQPIVSFDTGLIIAVEALARWKHPDLGNIAPAQFIPLSEETGMIIPVGDWVIQEACRQASVWSKTIRPIKVAVNLSARQFMHSGLVDTVANALALYKLNPELLDLELTESAIMKNAPVAIEIMQSLKRLGIRLSLDDFGTGYSSLAYLRRFPLDVLKIDRSFVSGVVEDPIDKAVIQSVIQLAKALKLQLVSEGVESEAQRDVLLSLGCSIMQGYYYSPPVTADNMTNLLNNQNDIFGKVIQVE